MKKTSPQRTLRSTAFAFAALCVIVGAGIAMVPAFAYGQIKTPALEKEKIAPLALSCIAEQAVINPGETTRIIATATNALNRQLTYSYSASAGSISSGGATALFSSAGVPAGTVSITCRVSDDLGREGAARTTIVISAPAMAIPPPDFVPGHTMTGAAPTLPPPPPPPPPHGNKGARPPLFPSDIHAPTAAKPAPVTSGPSSSSPTGTSQEIRTAQAPSNEYQQGYALEAWKKGRKQGQIEYAVPPSMKAQVPAPVSVKIHGFQDVAGAQPLLGATGSDVLKVSSYMKVELLAPLNPGEFAFAPLNADAVQFVPNDGSATWNWNVTPAYEAKNQKLEIRVSLVYKRPDTTLEDILEDKTYTVNVQVQKLTTTMWQDFQKDPIAFIKYMMPGGAGWVALAGFVTSLGGFAWWKKKRTRKAAHRTRGQ